MSGADYICLLPGERRKLNTYKSHSIRESVRGIELVALSDEFLDQRKIFLTQQVDAETMEKLILENKDMIKHISDALVEKNKLTGEEFGALMN